MEMHACFSASFGKAACAQVIAIVAALLLLLLLMQAPLELLLGFGSWSATCQSEPGAAPRCSLPQLLGFCKLLSWQQVLNPTPESAAATGPISYSYSFAYGPFAGWACLSLLHSAGAVADLVLWALLRLQYKLFSSRVYAEVRLVCVCVCVAWFGSGSDYRGCAGLALLSESSRGLITSTVLCFKSRGHVRMLFAV